MKSIRVTDHGPQVGWGEYVALDRRFSPMIERLERSAEQSSNSYRRKVVAAGLLGYGVLGGFVAFFVGLTILMVVLLFLTSGAKVAEVKGLVIFGAIAYGLVRSLWVGAVPPTGLAVTRSQAPALFAMIERIRAAVGGIRVHDVRLTDDMNAAITQQAAFWFFGSRNTLYLGLPLLLAMNEEEVRAIVAHEFGHFAGKHGHSAGFAYRIRVRWAQVSERLPQGLISSLLRRFFNWYGPWFASYSFVLARQQEYEADRVSARVTSQKVAADALARITVQADKYNRAWGAIWDKAASGDQPPSSPYRLLGTALAAEEPEDRSALASAYASLPDLDDTHPSLAQRVTALGQEVDLPPPLTETAAAGLLGDNLGKFIDWFDADWHLFADDNWRSRTAERKEQIEEREILLGHIGDPAATREDLYRYAWLVEALDGSGPAAAAYARVLERYPEAQDARYRLGETLLEQGDEQGLSELKTVAESDVYLAPYANRRIIDELQKTGRTEEAKPYYDALALAEERLAEAQAESEAVDEAIELEPLDPEMREQLVAIASRVYGIASLSAAQRKLKTIDTKQIVFVFSSKFRVDSQGVLDTLLEEMAPLGDALGIERSAPRRWLARRIRSIPGSKIL